VREQVIEPSGLREEAAEGGIVYAVLRWVMLFIVLTRASSDKLFGMFTIGGLPTGAVVNLVVIVGSLVLCIMTYPRWRHGVGPWWVLFIGLAVASLVHTPDLPEAVRFCAMVGTNIALLVLPFALFRTEHDLNAGLLIVVASAVVPILVGLTQLSEERIEATFPHPNIFAFYLCAVVIASAALLRQRKQLSPLVRRFVIGVLVACLFMLIETKTRGAWFGVAVAGLTYALLFNRRLLLLLPFTPLVLLSSEVRERLLDIGTPTEYIGDGVNANSLVWRQVLWESAYSWFREAPLLGYGIDSFHIYSPRFFAWEAVGYHSHNVYVQVAFELGVIGLFFFVMILLRLAWIAWRRRQFAHEESGILISLVVFYAVICYSDNILYYLSFNWYFWFLVGVFHCWLKIKSAEDQAYSPTVYPPE
jgi:putative inorganic carbon (HCO3(-)) transporter